MSEEYRRVREAMLDASSNDDLVDDNIYAEPEVYSQFDTETLDERYSTQMGNMWEQVRRDAND